MEQRGLVVVNPLSFYERRLVRGTMGYQTDDRPVGFISHLKIPGIVKPGGIQVVRGEIHHADPAKEQLILENLRFRVHKATAQIIFGSLSLPENPRDSIPTGLLVARGVSLLEQELTQRNLTIGRILEFERDTVYRYNRRSEITTLKNGFDGITFSLKPLLNIRTPGSRSRSGPTIPRV